MADIIGVITKVEDDSYQGKDFKKVTLGDGSVHNIKYGREGFLKAKWGELQVGRAYSFIMGDYQGHPFVKDFVAVEGELPEATHPEVIPEHMQKPEPEKPKSSPETGMWWKEMGDMLRSGDIKTDHPMYHDFRNAYYKEMSRVLNIPIRHES